MIQERHDLYIIQPMYAKLDVAKPPRGTIHAINDIIHGLSFLHDQRIAHGNLTVSNLFVFTEEFNPPDYNGMVCIADAGIHGSIVYDQCTKAEIRFEHSLRDGMVYRAPEQLPAWSCMLDNLSDETDSTICHLDMLKASDIYALAVIVCTLQRRKEPDITLNTLHRTMTLIAKTGERPECAEIDNMFDYKFCAFLKQCWAKDVSMRPSIHEFENIMSFY